MEICVCVCMCIYVHIIQKNEYKVCFSQREIMKVSDCRLYYHLIIFLLKFMFNVLFPNPAKTLVHFETKASMKCLYLYSMVYSLRD